MSRVAPARSLLTNGYARLCRREVVSREVLDQLHNLGQLVAEGLRGEYRAWASWGWISSWTASGGPGFWR